MNKYTPGKWVTHKARVNDIWDIRLEGKSYDLCTVWSANGNSKSDARLIAAAPDLLEACKALKLASEMCRAWDIMNAEEFNETYPDAEGWAFNDVDEKFIVAMETARAAISKAEAANE